LFSVPALSVEGDMHPVSAFDVVLPDELIKIQMVADVGKPPSSLGEVVVYAEVGGLAVHVLAVAHAAYGIIQLYASVAAPDLYFTTPPLAQWFQHGYTQSSEVDDGLLVGFVLYASRPRCRAGGEFFKCEMLCYLNKI
jgi:hypothetical protein